MRGKTRPISLHRRLIIDLMHASRDVPFVSLSRTIQIGPLLEARAAAARPPGFAALFVKAFALIARDEPVLRTLYVKWPWPSFYELPRSVATVTIARVENGEDCVLPQRVSGPETMTLAEIDAMIRQGKEAPVEDVAMFRKIMRATRLPLPLRRFAWWVGLSFGRQRANWFGNFSVTSIAACGGGQLHALSPGPFIVNYDVVRPDQTIPVLIRWDHRVTDGAMIARTVIRLEQVLNGEIAAELRACPAAGSPPAEVERRSEASRPKITVVGGPKG
ncbi:hypothetical protein [Bradyrhizobium sp. STM 3809]|uniref:hypothetical protein n=1 Tax=Bradyrhizobium sp. STM 3809 TaxID=551936 RepID=UPI00024093A1|nr:hypothetical protein [Bradyrhizobium sp. STM 3809]CCE01506.1 conserved hypothetical protein [Bradyrhizobium sp. STM 3809]